MKNLIPVVDLPSRLPGRPSVQTIKRWIRDGLLAGRNGSNLRIRLGAVRLGRKLFVTDEEIVAFGKALACAWGAPDREASK